MKKNVPKYLFSLLCQIRKTGKIVEICPAKALVKKKPTQQKKADTLDLVMCLILHLQVDLLVEGGAAAWPLVLDDQGTSVAF